MQQMIAEPKLAAPRRDPAPSKLRYRYHRLMLTPLFRRFLKVGLPVMIVSGMVGYWFVQDANREMLSQRYAAIRASIQERPEFMVKLMAIDGVDTALADEIRVVLPIEFPISSFDLELEEMRQTIAALNKVEDAAIRVRPGGVLQIDITQRIPVAMWRDSDGLKLIDAQGVFVAPVMARSDRPDLPLLAGDGARAAIVEGLQIYKTAGPLANRVMGVVRMGERRWDVVLDRNQRILLPTIGALAALERLVVLDAANDLFDRDISMVDMRSAARPTIRLNEPAVAELRRINGLETEAAN